MLRSDLPVSVDGHLLITEEDTGKVLVDKHNAIHPQNMARILARGLANEDNSVIHRIAFGNGGTFVDAAGSTVFRPPNDGFNGAGWESRLYNETYAEVVDEDDSAFGEDPGSAGPDNTRTGGGASPADDPSGGGVESEEVGEKSNVVITVVLNENEPSGQLSSNSPAPTLTDDEDTFLFDEIGLYSPGKPAIATSGSSSIDVGNKTSEDDSGVTGGAVYDLQVVVDGTTYTSQITVPVSGTGTGGAITYGDICEGINSGLWVTGGDAIENFAYFFITDRSGGVYPTISGAESFGFFTVQSQTTGSSSTVSLVCDSGNSSDLTYVLANNVCANANVNTTTGSAAGVINDSSTPANERERLLTHVIFNPILKSAESTIRIVYTLTVSVARSSDTDSTVNQT